MKNTQESGAIKHGLKREALQNAIEKATRGLYFVSEIDSEVFTVRERSESQENIKELHKLLKNADRKIVKIDTLKHRLTATHDWQNERAAENAAGFRRLFQLLEENLEALQIVRFGEVEVEIYVVGFDSEGRIAGIKMNAYET